MKSFRSQFKKDGPHGGHVFLVPAKGPGTVLNCTTSTAISKKAYDYQRALNVDLAGTQSRGVDLFEKVGREVGRFAQVLYDRVCSDKTTIEVAKALADIKAVIAAYDLQIVLPEHVTRTQITRALMIMTVFGNGSEIQCDALKIPSGIDRRREYQRHCFTRCAQLMDQRAGHHLGSTYIRWVLERETEGALPWVFGRHAAEFTATKSQSLEIHRADYERSLTKGELAYLAEEIHRNTANPMFAMAGRRNL